VKLLPKLNVTTRHAAPKERPPILLVSRKPREKTQGENQRLFGKVMTFSPHHTPHDPQSPRRFVQSSPWVVKNPSTTCDGISLRNPRANAFFCFAAAAQEARTRTRLALGSVSALHNQAPRPAILVDEITRATIIPSSLSCSCNRQSSTAARVFRQPRQVRCGLDTSNSLAYRAL
jgi:hypothetical protein